MDQNRNNNLQTANKNYQRVTQFFKLLNQTAHKNAIEAFCRNNLGNLSLDSTNFEENVRKINDNCAKLSFDRSQNTSTNGKHARNQFEFCQEEIEKMAAMNNQREPWLNIIRSRITGNHTYQWLFVYVDLILNVIRFKNNSLAAQVDDVASLRKIIDNLCESPETLYDENQRDLFYNFVSQADKLGKLLADLEVGLQGIYQAQTLQTSMEDLAAEAEGLATRTRHGLAMNIIGADKYISVANNSESELISMANNNAHVGLRAFVRGRHTLPGYLLHLTDKRASENGNGNSHYNQLADKSNKYQEQVKGLEQACNDFYELNQGSITQDDFCDRFNQVFKSELAVQIKKRIQLNDGVDDSYSGLYKLVKLWQDRTQKTSEQGCQQLNELYYLYARSCLFVSYLEQARDLLDRLAQQAGNWGQIFIAHKDALKDLYLRALAITQGFVSGLWDNYQAFYNHIESLSTEVADYCNLEQDAEYKELFALFIRKVRTTRDWLRSDLKREHCFAAQARQLKSKLDFWASREHLENSINELHSINQQVKSLAGISQRLGVDLNAHYQDLGLGDSDQDTLQTQAYNLPDEVNPLPETAHRQSAACVQPHVRGGQNHYLRRTQSGMGDRRVSNDAGAGIPIAGGAGVAVNSVGDYDSPLRRTHSGMGSPSFTNGDLHAATPSDTGRRGVHDGSAASGNFPYGSYYSSGEHIARNLSREGSFLSQPRLSRDVSCQSIPISREGSHGSVATGNVSYLGGDEQIGGTEIGQIELPDEEQQRRFLKTLGLEGLDCNQRNDRVLSPLGWKLILSHYFYIIYRKLIAYAQKDNKNKETPKLPKGTAKKFPGLCNDDYTLKRYEYWLYDHAGNITNLLNNITTIINKNSGYIARSELDESLEKRGLVFDGKALNFSETAISRQQCLVNPVSFYGGPIGNSTKEEYKPLTLLAYLRILSDHMREEHLIDINTRKLSEGEFIQLDEEEVRYFANQTLSRVSDKASLDEVKECFRDLCKNQLDELEQKTRNERKRREELNNDYWPAFDPINLNDCVDKACSDYIKRYGELYGHKKPSWKAVQTSLKNDPYTLCHLMLDVYGRTGSYWSNNSLNLSLRVRMLEKINSELEKKGYGIDRSEQATQYVSREQSHKVIANYLRFHYPQQDRFINTMMRVVNNNLLKNGHKNGRQPDRQVTKAALMLYRTENFLKACRRESANAAERLLKELRTFEQYNDREKLRDDKYLKVPNDFTQEDNADNISDTGVALLKTLATTSSSFFSSSRTENILLEQLEELSEPGSTNYSINS